MSLFSRAVAGAAKAAASISDKYIDEELQANRARMIADLQLEGQKKLDQYQNAPERQALLASNEAARERTVGAARNETALSGEVAKATNPLLQQARVDAENKYLSGTAQAKADAQSVLDRAKASSAREEIKTAAADAEFMQAQTKIKLADPEVAARIAASRASAASAYASAAQSGAQTEAIKLTIQDKKKLDALYDQAGSILSDTDLTDEQRAKGMAKVEKQIVLIKSKTGQAAARDPELDRVKITDEEMTPTGVRKTERTEVRRPGASSASGSAADPLMAELDKRLPPKAKTQAAAPAPKPAAAASVLPPTPVVVEKQPTEDLEKYTRSSPLYERAQAELRRRASAGYGTKVSDDLMQSLRR